MANEKDAMALAAIDAAEIRCGPELAAAVVEARAHLAARVAELEEAREVLFGGLDRARDNITARNLAVVAINALAIERDRATRAEAELANANFAVTELREELASLRTYVAANADRYVWLRERWGRIDETYHGTTSKIAKMAAGSQGWEVDPESLDRAIDAARGAG